MTALQTKHPKVRVVLPYVGPMEATAVRWLAPDPALKQKFDELDDVKAELANHLPFGRVGRECLLVENKAPYPVSIFMEKLWPLAPSLKVFFDEVVLRPGDKTPMQRLASVRKEGLKLEKQKKPAAAAALLAPLLAAFNSDPDPKRQYTEDHEEHVADAWNSLGVFYENAGDLAAARSAFEHAAWWGLALGAENYCEGASADDLPAGVDFLTRYLETSIGSLSHEEEANLRAVLVTWQLRLGAKAAAETQAVRWLSRFNRSAKKSLWPAQRAALLQQFKAQGVLGYDAVRLDKLAASVLAKR